MKKNLIIALIIVLAFVALIFVFASGNEGAPGKYDVFAACLAGKNITMYGADWCPHCQNEKKAFGDSFRFVPYVECPDNPELCLEKGIEGYPTWDLGGSRKLAGEQGLEKLSEESGCPLTQN